LVRQIQILQKRFRADFGNGDNNQFGLHSSTLTSRPQEPDILITTFPDHCFVFLFRQTGARGYETAGSKRFSLQLIFSPTAGRSFMSVRYSSTPGAEITHGRATARQARCFLEAPDKNKAAEGNMIAWRLRHCGPDFGEMSGARVITSARHAATKLAC
jgi:hypothetical protein